MSSRRPRRSRIYDSNYNMSENYYKSAIDRLDEKYSTRPSSAFVRHSEPPLALSPPRPRFNADAFLEEEDLEFARDRASRAIQKETVLDQRSRHANLGLSHDDSFDGQVAKTLERIQASKKLLSSVDLDNNYEGNEAVSQKIFKKRSVKISSDIASSAVQSSNALTKWSDSSDYHDSESYAAARARQSAARIQDIEQDMFDRSERQHAREQRIANAKKILADSEFDSSLTNGVSSLKISKSLRDSVSIY